MNVQLDRRYPIEVGIDPAWAILSDVRATAACMPGAAITEQIDATHFKGTVKTKVGPATMSFSGDIEVLGVDAATRQLKMVASGADKAGSSASMDLTARLEPGDTPASCVLVGSAVVSVNGKLAQFGGRLLVPVADMMLALFAKNFAVAAACAESAAVAGSTVPDAAPTAPQTQVAATETDRFVAKPAASAAVKELNALSFGWALFRGWISGLFGGRA